MNNQDSHYERGTEGEQVNAARIDGRVEDPGHDGASSLGVAVYAPRGSQL